VQEEVRTPLAELAGGERFDAVFLDPFSPRQEPDLWQQAFLSAIAVRMERGSWLATYSASLAVRAGLAAAGLRVGAGPAVGAKREGTLASPDWDPPALAPRTARRVRDRFPVRSLGPVSLKNLSSPVEVWEVRGPG